MTYNSKKTIGRPKLECDKDELVSLFNKYQSWRRVAKELGVSYGTIYRRLNEFDINTQKVIF